MAKQQSNAVVPSQRATEFDTQAVVRVLNRLLEMELAGIVRYTHYSLMVFGYNRIPIVSWLRSQANESMAHAQAVGELITHLGQHPSLAIGPLLETQNHDIGAILRESLDHELSTLAIYRELLGMVANKSILLEEFARKMVAAEEQHCGEVDKMLRHPGETGKFVP